MSLDDGDFSVLLTDLALLQHRNRPVKIVFFKSRPGTAGKPVKPSHTAALVGLLSTALDQKLARKISRDQFQNLRFRVNKAIRRLP